jgi:hypothetical protein
MNRTFHFPIFCSLKAVKLCTAPAPRAQALRACYAFTILFFLLLPAPHAHSQVLDTIGVTSLRAIAPGLLGSGVPVGQVEAGDPSWEVNPATVGQPVSLFTWISANGSAFTYPNGAGFESGHADTVASRFYANPGGVAPDVAQVANYEAEYFYTNIVGGSMKVPATIVNQSYIFGGAPIPSIDKVFDNYAAKYGTLFVNGAGNGGPVSSPASAFNCIAVGVYRPDLGKIAYRIYRIR